MMLSELFPDITIAASALVGLMILINRYTAQRNSAPAASRLIGLLVWLSLFLFTRMLAWISGFGFFWSVQWLMAATIPLFVVITAEVLLRQHAPKWLKFLSAFGGISIGLAAFWPGWAVRFEYIFLTLGFQLAILLSVAIIVLTRNRQNLSKLENQAIARISMSLVFVLPFLIADYHLNFMSIPVSPSGLAILVVCWLSLSLERARLAHTHILKFLLLYIGISIFGAIILAISFGLAIAATIKAGAIMFALVMAAAIVRDDLHLQAEKTQSELLTLIMSAPSTELDDYISKLSNCGILSGVLLLKSSDLKDYDTSALSRKLVSKPVLSLADLSNNRTNDHIVDSQLRTLFESYGATHLYLVAQSPLIIAATRQSGFAPGTVDNDLAAAFGLSRLLAERREKHSQQKGKTV
ncbi:hypothetical protein [Maritalea myrionectae]|uniref:hypothetical protein n=1 Tax=Maritalea myrionectae TaxID=454601 RepID=UPI0003FCC971|nr:hypothetical protein [Maritalea myrionectae]